METLRAPRMAARAGAPILFALLLGAPLAAAGDGAWSWRGDPQRELPVPAWEEALASGEDGAGALAPLGDAMPLFPSFPRAAESGAGGSGPDSKDLGDMNADQIAKKSANPLGGNFWILLNQVDNYFMDGDITDDTENLDTWSFQPVVPIPASALGDDWIWVNRPTFPFVMNADIPDAPGAPPVSLPPDGAPSPPSGFPRRPADVDFDSHSGFGEIVYFSLLGKNTPVERWGGGNLVMAAGPTFKFPTASRSEFGTGKFSAGPSGVLSFIGNEFILGSLYQHWISYRSGGRGNNEDVNYGWLNVFYFLNLGNGWQVGGTPIILIDYENDRDNTWTVPIGLGVYKTTFIAGKLPVKMGVEMQYMVVRPDAFGQRFNIRFTLAPIIPRLF